MENMVGGYIGVVDTAGIAKESLYEAVTRGD